MKSLLIFPALAFVLGASAYAQNPQAEPEDAKEILQRAIRAAGGEGRIRALQGPVMWMERGTFYGEGPGVPYIAQYAAKWPDWYRQEVEGAFVITVNGETAWVSGANGVQKMAGGMLDEALKQARLAWAERLFPLSGSAYTLSKIEGVTIDGKPTVGLKARHADGRDIKFYFDKETYQIAKIATMVISPPHGPEPVLREAFYTGRTAYGPAKFRMIYDGKLYFEGETVDYKVGATLDPKQFEPPTD